MIAKKLFSIFLFFSFSLQAMDHFQGQREQSDVLHQENALLRLTVMSLGYQLEQQKLHLQETDALAKKTNEAVTINEINHEALLDSTKNQFVEISKRISLLEKYSTKATKKSSSISQYLVQECGFPTAALVGTLAYCVYKPEAIRETREYIKAIPIPIFGLFIAASYLTFRFIKPNKGFSVMDYDMKEYGDLVKLLSTVKSQEERLNKFDNALNNIYFAIRVNAVTVEKNCVAIQTNREALGKFLNQTYLFADSTRKKHQELEEMSKNLQEKVQKLEEQQKENFFLTDIFKELQEDIRYKELLQQAETTEKVKY